MREKRLIVRVRTEEMESYRRIAEADGKSVSEWARGVLSVGLLRPGEGLEIVVEKAIVPISAPDLIRDVVREETPAERRERGRKLQEAILLKPRKEVVNPAPVVPSDEPVTLCFRCTKRPAVGKPRFAGKLIDKQLLCDECAVEVKK